MQVSATSACKIASLIIASSHISPLTSTCVVFRTAGPSLGTEVHFHFRRRPVQGYDVRPSFHLDAVSA